MNESSPTSPTPTPNPITSPTAGGAEPEKPADNGPYKVSPAQPGKPGGSKKMMFVVLVMVILAIALGAGGYVYGKSKAPAKVVTKTQVAAETELSVPQGATLISQCAKGRGTQYALPKDIPTGPVYNVYKGKVIGLEYMVGKDDLLTEGKNFLNLPMFKVKYDHINIGLLSQGHAGFPVPHYHVDIFTVPDTVATAITCT